MQEARRLGRLCGEGRILIIILLVLFARPGGSQLETAE